MTNASSDRKGRDELREGNYQMLFVTQWLNQAGTESRFAAQVETFHEDSNKRAKSEMDRSTRLLFPKISATPETQEYVREVKQAYSTAVLNILDMHSTRRPNVKTLIVSRNEFCVIKEDRGTLDVTKHETDGLVEIVRDTTTNRDRKMYVDPLMQLRQYEEDDGEDGALTYERNDGRQSSAH